MALARALILADQGMVAKPIQVRGPMIRRSGVLVDGIAVCQARANRIADPMRKLKALNRTLSAFTPLSVSVIPASRRADP